MTARVAFAQPEQLSRVLRDFDFEERSLGNPEDLPMHWSKVEGAGLPHYVNGKLTKDRAHQGEYSFRLDLNGGSLIYRYDVQRIKVQPGAHYRVEGFVQTTPLPYARARITAYFADLDGRPMVQTTRHSIPYASPEGDMSWKSIGVELSAPMETRVDRFNPEPVASTLVVELQLVQPAQYAASSLGNRSLFMQDIRGTAWFDDVTVSQVPKVSMSTEKPGNIFRRSDPLLLRVLVNDRFTDDLAAQLVITDAESRTVYQRSGALDMSAAQAVGPGQKRMSLSLPRLPAGWYEAALVMTSRGQFVGKQTLDLVLLADDANNALPDPRFGIVATDLPYQGWDDLPEILSILAAGRVKLAVWSEAGDVQQIAPAGFDRLLERLTQLNIEPTACLTGLPPQIVKQLAKATDPAGNGTAPAGPEANWLQLLKADKQLWQPQLAYMVARHSIHLNRWQLGNDGSDMFVTQPAMRQVYSMIYGEFANLVEHPDLAMPWPAWYELDGKLPATVALHVKPEVLPSQLPLYIKDIQATGTQPPPARNGTQPVNLRIVDSKPKSPNHNLSIFLEPLERAQYGRDVQIRDMVQRIVYALSANAQRIDLKLPFTVHREAPLPNGNAEPESVVKQPQELLLIARTVMSILSGATFRGTVPIAESVEAFLFDRDGQGILVLWDKGVTGGVRQLAINLGDRPVRVDLWGNATPLIQAAGGRHQGGVKLDIGPMPVFLLDIDGRIAQLRASVAFDNPLIESSFKPHTRKIRFVNPYRQAISGSFRLSGPPGWVINPPAGTFSLNPDEVFEREITLEFPYNSFAGTKTITADFEVQADTNSTFSAPVALKLGLTDVGLQTLALRDGNDVIIQQVIINYGDKPIDYTAFALFPGQPRQERLVTGLAPGRMTIKKYRFTNVKIAPQAKVRSGVKELDGTRILNDEVSIQ